MKRGLNAVCYMSMCLLGIYISVYQNQMNAIGSVYSLTSAMAGTIISLHFVGSFLTPVFSGEIADRIGKKSVIIFSFVILNAGLVFVCAFNSIALLALGIFLIGGGFAVIEGMVAGVLSDNNREHVGRVINISQVFFCIGAISGPLLAMAFTGIFGNWKAVFLFLLAMFIVAMVLIAIMNIKNSNGPAEKISGLITIRLFRERTFLIMVFSIFLYVGIEEGLAFWTTTYFDGTLDANRLGTYALSAFWGSMVVGRYLASRFENRYRLFIRAGLIISLLFSIILLVSRSTAVIFICFMGIGFGFSAVWPIIISMTVRRYAIYSGTAMGIMMTSSSAGGIVVPFLMGAAADVSTFKAAFIFVPVISLAILLMQARLPQKD